LNNISSPPLLDARGLGRRHPNGEDWLLRDVSLTICPGERLAITGPSAAGKTLLLRALALLDRLDTGEVLWGNKPIAPADVPEFRRQVIYLHQRPALFEGTVEENLRQPFSQRVHRGRRFDRDWLVGRLDSVGRAADFLERFTRDLSGGESQIVALLRALQLTPRILLLDEPTAALDPETAQAAEQLVADWLAEDAGQATVWVSHNVDQARRVANRMLRLVAGKMETEV
jgi:putative ABC transport system ATP-binding protein